MYIEKNPINALQKNQILALFQQAYLANIAMFVVGMLVWVAFIYSEQLEHFDWFISLLVLSISSRLLLTYYSTKCDEKHLAKVANYYVFGTFLLGLDFSLLTYVYFDLQNIELRTFLTIVNLGLITAAITTMAVWMKAYIAFTLPQLVALFAVFIINDKPYIAASTILFSIFMIAVARNFNKNFKDGRSLIDKNIQLVSDMEKEILSRKNAQQKLENHRKELEQVVNDRTKALEKINENLNDQIKKRLSIEKELEYLAYYDELTNMPNRTLFIETLKKALIQSKRNESLLGVMFVDLDRFKKINDSHGHFIGDNLLLEVSKRLKNVLRDSDTIARNGGDEFVILSENMKDASEPFIIANKVIEAVNQKFKIEGHVIHVGACVGISLFPLDGDEALDLIKMADTAMYEAKKIGSNNFQFYSSSMSLQIKDRLKLENALRAALDKNEFFLVYQPQVNLVTQETCGFEALIRWDSPEFGIVSPIKFIPILEETGLIYDVGEWIILEVLNFIKSGKSHNTKVSINLSALQCGITNYSSQIKRYIDSTGVDPTLVEFEITETVLIGDFTQAEMFLTDISNLGCTVALDDFGTGYTSFEYLTKLPIDIIKIDRSLITNIHMKKNLQNIVKAIVTMSESLGISNVFEGVETHDELQMVSKLNGSIIQGYFYSKPLDVADIDAWFDKHIIQSQGNL